MNELETQVSKSLVVGAHSGIEHADDGVGVICVARNTSPVVSKRWPISMRLP